MNGINAKLVEIFDLISGKNYAASIETVTVNVEVSDFPKLNHIEVYARLYGEAIAHCYEYKLTESEIQCLLSFLRSGTTDRNPSI